MSPLNLHNISVNYCFSARKCSCISWHGQGAIVYRVSGYTFTTTPVPRLFIPRKKDQQYQHKHGGNNTLQG